MSILLFALGIVALVGLQASSLKTTDDVQYRAEAVHLASAYMGKIWAAAVMNGAVAADISGKFETGGPGYTDFSTQVTAGIPGASQPTVTIVATNDQVTNQATGLPVTVPGATVTITINWVDRENNDISHTYTQSSIVSYNL
ncbi:MAG: hypothetical protein LBB65_04950 [Burkholderiales bacterium]|nr:hypothetical protein [Burkholderiales bacterium]